MIDENGWCKEPGHVNDEFSGSCLTCKKELDELEARLRSVYKHPERLSVRDTSIYISPGVALAIVVFFLIVLAPTCGVK